MLLINLPFKVIKNILSVASIVVLKMSRSFAQHRFDSDSRIVQTLSTENKERSFIFVGNCEETERSEVFGEIVYSVFYVYR